MNSRLEWLIVGIIILVISVGAYLFVTYVWDFHSQYVCENAHKEWQMKSAFPPTWGWVEVCDRWIER